MARVIDIQPITEEIQSSLEIPSYSEHDEGFDDGLKYVLDLIEKAPTITPPTVGRCKDCDNWDEDLSAGRKRMNNYVCCCQEWSDFEDGRCRYTRPNDYCSYFEQREALKNGKTD